MGFCPTGLSCIREAAQEPTPNLSDTPRPRPPASDLLLRAVTRLLRPLVRLLLHGGVTFPVLVDALRDVYVEVARTELLTDPRARTDSRISLLTGVHRKELRRQRLEERTEPEPPAVTRTSAVLARWLGSAGFQDAQGQPAALPRSGPAPSFEALVGSVTRDVRPRTVLDELVNSGAVRLDGDAVVLDANAFVPRDGDEAKTFFFARNLHDHLAAAGANLLGGAPFLDRAVHLRRAECRRRRRTGSGGAGRGAGHAARREPHRAGHRRCGRRHPASRHAHTTGEPGRVPVRIG